MSDTVHDAVWMKAAMQRNDAAWYELLKKYLQPNTGPCEGHLTRRHIVLASKLLPKMESR